MNRVHVSPHFPAQEAKVTKKKVKSANRRSLDQKQGLAVVHKSKSRESEPTDNSANMMIIEGESEDERKKPVQKVQAECFVPTNSVAQSNAEPSSHHKSPH